MLHSQNYQQFGISQKSLKQASKKLKVKINNNNIETQTSLKLIPKNILQQQNNNTDKNDKNDNKVQNQQGKNHVQQQICYNNNNDYHQQLLKQEQEVQLFSQDYLKQLKMSIKNKINNNQSSSTLLKALKQFQNQKILILEEKNRLEEMYNKLLVSNNKLFQENTQLLLSNKKFKQSYEKIKNLYEQLLLENQLFVKMAQNYKEEIETIKISFKNKLQDGVSRQAKDAGKISQLQQANTKLSMDVNRLKMVIQKLKKNSNLYNVSKQNAYYDELLNSRERSRNSQGVLSDEDSNNFNFYETLKSQSRKRSMNQLNKYMADSVRQNQEKNNHLHKGSDNQQQQYFLLYQDYQPSQKQNQRQKFERQLSLKKIDKVENSQVEFQQEQLYLE